MENTNWLKQATDKPLFPDVLWNRPENRRHAGKLLIVGGHQQSFNAVSDAYAAAAKAGAGTLRVMLPDKLEKMLARLFPEAEFAPSTPIGSFARPGLAKILEAADWADGVLLAGDFGKNSETAILLEGFADKYGGPLAVAGDAVDYFLSQPAKIANREKTLVITSLDKLQKLASPALIQQKADFMKAINQISGWAAACEAAIVTWHTLQVIVAWQQQISTTLVKQEPDMPALAAYATVWWLQQPTKPFEALTAAVFCFTESYSIS